MTYDGSPEHLTWDGLDEAESEELKSRAENARSSPIPEADEDFPRWPRSPFTFPASKLDPQRLEQIRVAALHAMGRRNGFAHSTPPNDFEPGADPFNLKFKQPPGLLPPEVRKNLQGNIVPQVSPAMMRTPNWNANIFQTFSRLMIYGFGGLRWGFGIMWDKVRGRDSIERRAASLRETIERIGGSAVKVGQQMAMRIDLLPYEYTVELTKMLDRMTTFPTSYAIQRIEAVMGRPLLDVFDAFDPVPIGSASVACGP